MTKDKISVLDLSNAKDYEKYKDLCNDIKTMTSSSFFKNNLFSDYFNEYIGALESLGELLHNKLNDEDTKKPELPSDKLSLDQKSSIHKITTEYVDTVLRKKMTDDEANDLYGELFEFGCWVLNK